MSTQDISIMEKSKHSIISVISLGIGTPVQLNKQATLALVDADLIIASQRQWDSLSELSLDNNKLTLLPSPFAKLSALIAQTKANNICILASGDSLFYGIGGWINKHYNGSNNQHSKKLVFFPNISSIQFACHRIGLAWQDIIVHSCHGRPLNSLVPQLRKNRYFAMFTDALSRPKDIAKLLAHCGYQHSIIWVCESLGYKNERIQSYTLASLLDAKDDFDVLNVCLFHCLGDGNERCPEFPGISDTAFFTESINEVSIQNLDNKQITFNKGSGKGLLTKKTIRLSILSALEPSAGDISWDIGAGCGGVSVEWARYNPRGKLFAIEQNAQRFELLTHNVHHFGVMQSVTCLHDDALSCISTLPIANKIFIGGHGGQLLAILTQAWEKLAPSGILVVSAVTESSRSQCWQFVDSLKNETDKHSYQANWIEIAIKTGETLAGQLLMKPALPVTLLTLKKLTLKKQSLNKTTQSTNNVMPKDSTQAQGTLFGIGLGPGDPELLTLKAEKIIARVDVIAYLENDVQYSLARNIAQSAIEKNTNAKFLAIPMTYTKNRKLANLAYDQAAESISGFLRKGLSVAYLCEGDPLFYGSFIYLLERLGEQFNCEVVPGISSIHTASARTLQPLCQLQQNLIVINSRHSDQDIIKALQGYDHLCILKVGKHRSHLLSLIAECGRIADTTYCENLSRENEKIISDVTPLLINNEEHKSEATPYFSLLLVNKKVNNKTIKSAAKK